MPSVVLERHEAVLEIVLNRPAALNAANRELIGELATAVAEAAEDAASRVVLLRGAGSHFCAGGDINMFGELISLEPEARGKELHAIVGMLHPLLIALRHMPKPVVAAVQGAAAGFGLSLVLAADLALAAEDAVFASGYIHLGTSPDGGMTMTLPRIVGLKRAAELILLGERVDARRALELGLVNRLLPPAALEVEARALATRLADGPNPCLRAHQSAARGFGRSNAECAIAAGDRKLRHVRRVRGIRRRCRSVSRKTAAPIRGNRTTEMKSRRRRWAAAIALASAGLLSGCYYYPYGYYPGSYSYPYAWGYPYSPGYPYPPPTAVPPIPPNPSTGVPQPPDEPVQRAPLPPPAPL